MKIALFSAVASALLALSLQPAFATESMSGSAMMPTCAKGDSVVALHSASKEYLTMAQVKAAETAMSPAQAEEMMTKNHVTMSCMSKAMAMGAKQYVAPNPLSDIGSERNGAGSAK